MNTNILDNTLVKTLSFLENGKSEKGSGCLFRYPNQDSNFIILVTAKHCVYGEENMNGISTPNMRISYLRGETGISKFQIQEPPLIIKSWGDIAFFIFEESELCQKLEKKQLKIDNFQVIKTKPKEVDKLCYFRGYPDIADGAITMKGEYRSGNIRNKFTIESLTSRGKDRDIDGMSGCGVFMKINNDTFLTGIVIEQDSFNNVHCISLASIYSNPTFKTLFSQIAHQKQLNSLSSDYQNCKIDLENAIQNDSLHQDLLPRLRIALDKIRTFDFNDLQNTEHIKAKIQDESHFYDYMVLYLRLKRHFEFSKYEECLQSNNDINPENLPNEWKTNKVYDKIINHIKNIEQESRHKIEVAKRKKQEQKEQSWKRWKPRVIFLIIALIIFIPFIIHRRNSNQQEIDKIKFQKNIENANFFKNKGIHTFAKQCYEKAHQIKQQDSLIKLKNEQDSLYQSIIKAQSGIADNYFQNIAPDFPKQVFMIKANKNIPTKYQNECGWYSENKNILVPAMFWRIEKKSETTFKVRPISGSDDNSVEYTEIEPMWIETDTLGNCINCWDIDLENFVKVKNL